MRAAVKKSYRKILFGRDTVTEHSNSNADQAPGRKRGKIRVNGTTIGCGLASDWARKILALL